MLQTDKQEQGECLLVQPSKAKKSKERIFWVDWVRAIGIHSVTIVHCINYTDIALVGDQKEDNNNTVFEQQRQACYRFFVQFGMPLFFYISGMSAGFFNFDKPHSFWRFFVSKVKRLVFPLIFGIFFLLMP